MLKLEWPRLAIVALVLAPLAGAQSPTTNHELPPGPSQAKARAACTTCHDAHIIAAQRLTKAAWAKEVDKMIKWGAIVNASDRDALVDYLSANFSPAKPPYRAPRSAANR
ncbi:MAG: hypothetical protein J2P13_02350 [Acidobacteria bacterium]|nr:hypothetical protein [Acidobacteriota bacterium]